MTTSDGDSGDSESIQVTTLARPWHMAGVGSWLTEVFDLIRDERILPAAAIKVGHWRRRCSSSS